MLYVGSPDMSPIRHHSPKHSGASPSYGATAFLNFFFHRVTRSGPRLLLYLALLLASSLMITKLLPTGISDSIATATSTGHLWKLRPGLGGFDNGRGSGSSQGIVLPGENNQYDALVGGGLRVVVFGENDIATSILKNVPANVLGPNNGTTWTRELCSELGCSTYLSYVPELEQPRRSLTSNPLYGAITDDIVREAKDATPANDYTYVKESYPINWEAADLYAQVSRFLNQPAPARAPKESVYVFSFGMWDVWTLAAFPYSHAEGIINILVGDIFKNIETLYSAAHDPKSVAYSNYTSSPLEEAAINDTLLHNMDSKNKQAAHSRTSDLVWDDAGADPFRVIVPLLFDPSLVPGWHMGRPDAPALHTKPEQLRNAVRLTKRWNDYVINEMETWMKKGVEFTHPEDQAKIEAAAKKGENIDGSKPTPPNLSGRDEPAPENTAPENEKPANTENTKAKVEFAVRPGQPVLIRDGIVFRLSDYVMDAIIDGQMKKLGLADRKSFGTFFSAESYLEVDRPCLMPSSIDIPAEAKKISIELHTVEEQNQMAEAKKAVEANEEQPAEETKTKPTKRSPGTTSASTGPALEMCERPDRHLFFTPFSLGQRAIEEVGRMSAALVRANRTTRLDWEQTSRDSNGVNRAPGSWKVYFMPS